MCGTSLRMKFVCCPGFRQAVTARRQRPTGRGTTGVVRFRRTAWEDSGMKSRTYGRAVARRMDRWTGACTPNVARGLRPALGLVLVALAVVGLPGQVLAQGCPCNGDQDGDGIVTLTDVNRIVGCVGQPPTPPCDLADVNCDGVIDQTDVDAAMCQFQGGGGIDPTCCATGCVDGQVCTSDAECNPGACRDKRCLGGPNDQGFCASDADCPFGVCEGSCICKCTPPGDDCFTTPCNGMTFLDFSANAIPADHFFAGSPPFAGQVNLGGPGAFPADTTVRRLETMCFPDPLPSTAGPIQVEIVQLDLQSCSPVVVGGQAFDMFVGLDPANPSLGDMTATKETIDGGTFTSNLNINALIWFVPVGGGVGTTALQQPINLTTPVPLPWLQNDPGTFCGASGFFPGWQIDPLAGIPCCVISCHAGPTPTHPHCVQAPDCTKCPSDPPQVDPCPAPDPVNDPCAGLAATQCQLDPVTNEECRPTVVQMQGGALVAVGCRCIEPGVKCGPIEIDVAGGGIRCPGGCPQPNPNGICSVFLDGTAMGTDALPLGAIPDGAIVTCDCPGGGPDPDPHTTIDPTDILFGSQDVPAIPADFFEPGSEPFDGLVAMVGGGTDTLVRRSAPVVCPGTAIPRPCDVVDIEIVELSLRSIQPITVSTAGGAALSDWDVRVGLSNIGSSGLDGLTASRTNSNGGLFDAHIPVLPRLTFTRVDNPTEVRVLDFGEQGLPPIQINFFAVPWVVNLNPELQGNVVAPNDGNFVPGIEHEDIGFTQTVQPATGVSKGGGVTHTVRPLTFCPLANDQLCAPLQQRDCAGSPTNLCEARLVQAIAGGIEPIECACFDPDVPGCGPITVGSGGNSVSCLGTCAAPQTPPCQIWSDDGTGPRPSGQTTAPIAAFPPGAMLFCDCTPPCQSDAECDDGNPCTNDTCLADGTCQNTLICTTDAQCDDGNSCTTDSCRADGCCDNIPDCTVNSDCDDGDLCTVNVCDALTGCCVTTSIPDCCTSDADCNDGDVCTNDRCDLAAHVCVYTPICLVDTDCDDGNVCTNDTCRADGCCDNLPICTSDADCNDGNVCTTDVCRADGCCDNTPDCTVDADCADTDPCTIDTCRADGCCNHQPDPNCVQACCLPGGLCAMVPPADCRAQHGKPLGAGTACLGDLNNDGIDDACFVGPCGECGPGAHWIDTPACPAADPTVPGICKATGGSCFVDADCPGICESTGAGPCSTDADCTGLCFTSGAACNTDADCGLAGGPCGGICHLSGAPCLADADCTAAGDFCRAKVCNGVRCNRISEDQDTFPTGAKLGIDLNFDCIADTSVRMHGPATIHKIGPYDDSVRYPGLRPIDMHKDVIDTEILHAVMSRVGVTLTIGQGLGVGNMLAATTGAVAELPSDPFLADSFFDVYAEVTGGGLPGPAYNQTPIRVQTVVPCLPPDTKYIHFVGCTPLYDTPVVGMGAHIGNLVSALHFTYPDCCLDGGLVCLPMPILECEAAGGTPVAQCLGDSNGDGFDDACVPPVDACPMPPGQDWCAQLQASQCVPNDPTQPEFCLPRSVTWDPVAGPMPTACECFVEGPGCGPVEIRQITGTTQFTFSCPGDCPDGTPNCFIHIDGVNTGSSLIDAITVPVGSVVTCDCPVLDCQPTADQSACEPTACADMTQVCEARCVNYDAVTGATLVTDCDCRGPNDCHVDYATPAGPAAKALGGPCVVVDDGSGTVTLPPAGCEYLSPEEVHEIMDGLPIGTTIEFAPIHKDFICEQGAAGGFPGCPPPGLCEQPGGDLGGQVDCFMSALDMTVQGTGTLGTFSRQLFVPVNVQVHTGPRTPGDAVQDFDTEMVFLQGELFGDPDFCTFRVTGGSGFGLPSPGHTTLTRQGGPGGSFAVDSFFDITYQIEFQGCAGGALPGMGGVTTRTIRMQTGSKPACVGGCPSGLVCQESEVPNSDGVTVDICCDCVEPTGACCLSGGACAITTASDCAVQGGVYRGDGTDCSDNDGNGIPDECQPDVCEPTADGSSCQGPCPTPSCFGECINGAYCDDPACCIDPNACMCYLPYTKESILRCGDCFGECIDGAYCDDVNRPECWITPGAGVCYGQNSDISIQLCPDNTCFGECVAGAYCDGLDPACCIGGPANCQCYLADHPISLKLCDPSGAPQPQACQAKCATVDPLTGVTTVSECDCTGVNGCHVDLPATAGGAALKSAGGDPCVVPDDAGGTVTLPPAGCDYLSPEEVHEIIDGLPAGTTIEFAAIHKDFICNRGDGFPGCPPPGICEDTGGDLGGNVDCFESVLELNLTSTGTGLPGFARTMFLPVLSKVHTGPRTPGDPVQSFDTEMVALQGELFGDPDFCTFRVTGGRDFGLPSPGHTTLTELPSGDFAVDSFFDVFYSIEFQGCPGSLLEGFGGTTQGTVRMTTGTTPSCVGVCGPNETCVEEKIVNADGTISVCCRCGCPVVDAPAAEVPAVAKTRVISMVPGNAGRLTRLRVTLTNLPGAYSIWNGQKMWVTNAQTMTEQSGEAGPLPEPTFTVANLSCQSDCRDWGSLGLIDVYGEPIIPGAQYEVQAIDCSCDLAVEANYSSALPIATSRYGDVVDQFNNAACLWTPPNGVVSIPFDTVSLVDKFKNIPCAPRKARADQVGVPPNSACLDMKISISDIVDNLNAFRGIPYPYSPSAANPCDAAPCPNP